MDKKNNQKLQALTARDTVKIRRANNGYVINSSDGMAIASNLEEVKQFLDEKFSTTTDIK